MAEIDITILDIFVRYVLPLLIGYLVIFHLCWGLWIKLFEIVKLKILTYTLRKYWTKVYTCHDKDIRQTFAPLFKLERTGDGKRLRVLEIGIGEGSNFKFYPPNCDVFGVDPEGAIEPILKENISKHDGLELKLFKAAGAEDMSYIEDNSIDAVVCTLVLCSVYDPPKVLKEINRVLRKDGVFIFWEHVCASDERVASKQRLFSKIWYILYGGCHLTRKSWEYIEGEQFSTHEFSTINLPFISLISTTLYGSATK